VFTPLEYSSCGYSEESAKEKFGNENIEVICSRIQFVSTVAKIVHYKNSTAKCSKSRTTGFLTFEYDLDC